MKTPSPEKRPICTRERYETISPLRCAPLAPSETGLPEKNDFSMPGISSRNKLRACRQKLEKSELELSTAQSLVEDLQKKEKVQRLKYNKMKSIAKRERTTKRQALAQVAQLQGLLQGLQMSTANNNFMQSQPMFTNQMNRQVQPMFLNMLPATNSIPILAEDDSIESVTIPDDV